MLKKKHKGRRVSEVGVHRKQFRTSSTLDSEMCVSHCPIELNVSLVSGNKYTKLGGERV